MPNPEEFLKNLGKETEPSPRPFGKEVGDKAKYYTEELNRIASEKLGRTVNGASDVSTEEYENILKKDEEFVATQKAAMDFLMGDGMSDAEAAVSALVVAISNTSQKLGTSLTVKILRSLAQELENE